MGSWLNSLLKAARISSNHISRINTIGCYPPAGVYPTEKNFEHIVPSYWYERLRKAERKNDLVTISAARTALAHPATNADGRAAVTHCIAHHLRPQLERRWTRVVALGDEALKATTGRKGITEWRGSPLPLLGHTDRPLVVPTLHPTTLMRSANLFSVVTRDLRRKPEVPPEHYQLYPTLDAVQNFDADTFSFDFEWDGDGKISLCGLADKYYHALVVPFCWPYIDILKSIFENAKTLIGHNIIGADLKYIEQLGWNIKARLLDTMLMQHLIQPDMRHGLSFVASVFTNKVFWKGKGEEMEDEDGNFLPTGAQWKTWDSPDALPVSLGGYGGCTSADEAFRLYNARDTDATLQCVAPLEAALDKYNQRFTYENVSVPVGFICRSMSETGWKIDHTKLNTIRTDLDKEIESLEQRLPEGLKPYEVAVMRNAPAPPDTYKIKIKTCKGSKKNGTKHDPTPIAFTTPNVRSCPVCDMDIEPGSLVQLKIVKVPGVETVIPWNSSSQVIKYADSIGCDPYINKKTKQITANKNARKVWGRTHTEFTLVDRLKKLSTLRTSFAKDELMNVDRMYFNILVHGTAEGRLASSGKRRGVDLNIQNQPKSMRYIYVPDEPTYGIMDNDIIQGENMLTAWLAHDWPRWERLNTPGFDEHSYMASKFFNKPIEAVMKGGVEAFLRDPGKIVNHSRNYGSGPGILQELLAFHGYFYSVPDIQEMIQIWKKENALTAKWQAQVVELVQRQTYLENPFGRRRWFQSRDFATKALAFLPASTLADMVLRMMIGLHPNGWNDYTRPLFQEAVYNLKLETVAELPPFWRMVAQVHDSLVIQGPDETHLDAARATAAVMTQRWPQLDNFRFGVESKYSTSSWGECKPFSLTSTDLKAA